MALDGFGAFSPQGHNQDETMRPTRHLSAARTSLQVRGYLKRRIEAEAMATPGIEFTR